MAARRKETPAQKAVKKILERKGMDYKEWEKNIINQRKLEIMADEDKKWTEKTIEEESMNLIMNDVINQDHAGSHV